LEGGVPQKVLEKGPQCTKRRGKKKDGETTWGEWMKTCLLVDNLGGPGGQINIGIEGGGGKKTAMNVKKNFCYIKTQPRFINTDVKETKKRVGGGTMKKTYCWLQETREKS